MRTLEEAVIRYKGQPGIIVADEPLTPLPGSEIIFLNNAVCQGLAFKDIDDGSYFPAASMYTLPSQVLMFLINLLDLIFFALSSYTLDACITNQKQNRGGEFLKFMQKFSKFVDLQSTSG